MGILNEGGVSTTTRPPKHHAVQFYRNDACLANTVAGFLAEGLALRQPAIIVATPAHRTAIVDALATKLVDCEQAVRDGDLVLIDAEEALDLFVTGDSPDAGLFEANVGRIVEQALNGRQVGVRAYGEIVDVLCRQGRPEVAVKLEMLWNALSAKYDISLFCGYAEDHASPASDLYAAIAAQHSQVVEPGSRVMCCSKRRAS